MRISDWSSDVCSSDLVLEQEVDARLQAGDVPPVLFQTVDHKQDAANLVGDSFHLTLVVFLPRLLHFARSEEHTSELQSLMRISYAVFCLKKKISQIK